MEHITEHIGGLLCAVVQILWVHSDVPFLRYIRNVGSCTAFTVPISTALRNFHKFWWTSSLTNCVPIGQKIYKLGQHFVVPSGSCGSRSADVHGTQTCFVAVHRYRQNGEECWRQCERKVRRACACAWPIVTKLTLTGQLVVPNVVQIWPTV